MSDKEKLYEILGELLFVVAKADGVIQDEEKEALETYFKDHPYGKDIRWSFNYEAKRNTPADVVYNKVIDYCKHYGPANEYQEFIKAMEVVAEAADGIDDNETAVMQSFSQDLLTRFKNDIDAMQS
ncbi:tellurite resistance TerB family protein [Flammeovirga aprica]|uniref:TerB family tellurite resistance protein n=1 Tax=Flammeovirga aprica JL-4 TaxID=694437 RepID=A0A7X9S0J4_9BACT|nr:TerB family tellurite resistance protein [Flammeovirga aprica]NME71932.1 TerB family tellurite resistance protein [Flammeovirga aprica JL-4]